MGTMSRSRHSDDDFVNRELLSNGNVRLTCTDGWEYEANPEFVDAVEKRHCWEAKLPS